MRHINWFVIAVLFGSFAFASSYPVLSGLKSSGSFLGGPVAPSPSAAPTFRALTIQDIPGGVTSKATNHTANNADDTIVFTADATLTLPAAAGVTGKKYHVVASGSGTDITIDPNASETVCGSTTIQVNGTSDAIVIQSDGSNWMGLESSCERTTRLKITNSGTPTITSQQGNWVTSLSDGGTGVTTINIPAGIFSAAPTCSVTITNSGGGVGRYCNFQSVTATSIVEYCFNSGASDENNDVLCKGPR